MKTNINYLALIVLTCGVAACNKSDAPNTSSTETTPAAAENAPAPSADPTSGGAADDGTTAAAIAPGVYTVCDLAETTGHVATARHRSLSGDHLGMGRKVEIRNILPQEATVVCIGADGCPADLNDPTYKGKVLWMIGDENRLATVQSLDHQDDQSKTRAEPHLIQIINDPTDIHRGRDECDTANNVLTFRICSLHASPTPMSQWLCGSTAGPHGSDAHIQN